MIASDLPTMLRRAVQRWPDRPFLRWSDSGRALEFAETDAQSDRAAAALAALGVGASGDPRLPRIEVVDTIPQTPTGKLDKITLRQQFATGHS